jgi:type IV secretion system protein VirB10
MPAANAQPASPPVFLPQPAIIEAPQLSSTALTAQATPAVTNDRILAGHLRNPGFTVPQGTVIPAVLETALDSTRPGGVRAIVERDIMGFDGTRVLIPRGSRLYGEYASDVGPGQKRALIRWTRLTRPDAVIVNLDSPAADPLGRAGVGGKVNSHFLERFSGAILQSVLDVGVGVATRSITDNGLILALPGSTQNISPVQPQQVQRTLKVRQGTSVSVFVARDLDFSIVDQ